MNRLCFIGRDIRRVKLCSISFIVKVKASNKSTIIKNYKHKNVHNYDKNVTQVATCTEPAIARLPIRLSATQ